MPDSHSHSRPCGRRIGMRADRATASRMPTAAAYRIAWAANSGASVSGLETPTLPPTSVMARMPVIRFAGLARPRVFAVGIGTPCRHNGLMGRAKQDLGDRSITPGADFLQLHTGDAPAGGLSGWLARQLRLAIEDARLPVGGRLPATRVLAGDLGVSRGVVTEAYRRLTEDGHVAGHGRGGTAVVAAPGPAPAPAPPPGP